MTNTTFTRNDGQASTVSELLDNLVAIGEKIEESVPPTESHVEEMQDYVQQITEHLKGFGAYTEAGIAAYVLGAQSEASLMPVAYPMLTAYGANGESPLSGHLAIVARVVKALRAEA